MLEVRSLSRHYGKHTAVDDVSFTIDDGEIVGLLGHNGAGKTTIMKILSGYLEPSAGSLIFNGSAVAGNARSLQSQLGYLPENLPVYPEMMVADYLEYAATLKGIAPAERMQSVRDAVAAADLGERALDTIDTLSRGLRQRVGVAQAILGRPKLLILDEPTNGLDIDHTEHMRKLIRRMARRATVILSTHIMQEVEAVCDRVLVLREGKLVLDQSLEVLRDSHQMMLRTCGSASGLLGLLRRLPQITAVSNGADHTEFTLNLRPDADPDLAAGNIAQCVVQAGGRLYCLQPLDRDLPGILRAASSGGPTAGDPARVS